MLTSGFAYSRGLGSSACPSSYRDCQFARSRCSYSLAIRRKCSAGQPAHSASRLWPIVAAAVAQSGAMVHGLASGGLAAASCHPSSASDSASHSLSGQGRFPPTAGSVNWESLTAEGAHSRDLIQS